MSIWNKILLGCIFVAATALFILSARALYAHSIWQGSHNAHKEAIAAAEQQAKELVDGSADEMGLREAKLELYKLLVGRGRVWDNCEPTRVDTSADPNPDIKEQRVQIAVQMAPGNSVEAKSVLYAFEDKPVADGGSYLGQFTVESVAGRQIELRPSMRLAPSELARVQASQQAGTTWRLYELMPTDRHEVLAKIGEDAAGKPIGELTEEEISAMFPTEATFGDADYATVNDYLWDGQITTKENVDGLQLNGRVVMVDENDEPVRNEQGVEIEVTDSKAKGMFIRDLRGYEIFFDEMHRLRAKNQNTITVATQDLAALRRAHDDARVQEQTRRQEIDDVERELAEMSRRRDVVKAHEAALTGAIASMRRAITDLIARNEATIAEVGRIQMEVARLINARTASMAQKSGR